ncbi:unnamed protein product [Brassica oleracea]
MRRRLGLPLTTTRLFNPAPWISSHRSTIRYGHPHRITTASSMSQQSVEIGTVRGASTRSNRFVATRERGDAGMPRVCGGDLVVQRRSGHASVW